MRRGSPSRRHRGCARRARLGVAAHGRPRRERARGELGESGVAELTTVAPARSSPFSTRVIAMTRTFRRERVRERVLLVLPVGRSPPRGAILEATVRVAEPRPPRRRLRRARLARAPGHPRGARGVELASDRPPRGSRRPRGPAARPRRARGRARYERRPPRRSSSASSSARTRGCRPTCRTTSAPRGSTTCSPCRGRTSPSSPPASSASAGCCGCHGSRASS